MYSLLRDGTVIGSFQTLDEAIKTAHEDIFLPEGASHYTVLFDDLELDLSHLRKVVFRSAPDPFTFLTQTSVARSSTITSNSATIASITVAVPVTVTNGTWAKNGGAFSSSAGTVVNGDTVQVRHTSSGSFDTSVQTTLNVGGTTSVFVSTTLSSPNRTGIIWTLSGESLDPIVNPEWLQWQVPIDSTTDGVRAKHIGQAEYGRPANVRALHHFSIVSGSDSVGSSSGVTSVDGDGKWFKGTIYPKWTNSPTKTVLYSPAVDYSGLDQPQDKSRINIVNGPVVTDLHDAGPNDFHYRKEHWICMCYFIAADYVEDTVSSRETYLQLGDNGDNNFDLSIQGGSGGADWTIERSKTAVGAAPATKINLAGGFSTPLTNAMKGAWNIHIFNINIDNRTGGSPKFKWWHGIKGSPLVLLANDTTTPWGFDDVGDPGGWKMQTNLVYKGSWHGASGAGAYNGTKNAPIVTGLDGVRVGNSSSSYSDVHPTRDAMP